ncbi:MAG TPA: DUF5675 family protein [Pyrinomonadaceae bacterium]|jgi:hypothetical protein
MELRLARTALTGRSTIGELSIDGVFECYTLEDCVRPVKIKNVTAIPAGRYRVIINQSQRFKRLLPLLLDVPQFEGVRIHSGNAAGDTEGCILVGQTKAKDFIGNSRVAFDKLFTRLLAAVATEEIFINIKDVPSAVTPPARPHSK